MVRVVHMRGLGVVLTPKSNTTLEWGESMIDCVNCEGEESK